MAQDIADRVKQIVAEQLGVKVTEVREDVAFVDLGADSLALVETVLAIEEAFDLAIADAEVALLRTVGDAIGQVARMRKPQ